MSLRCSENRRAFFLILLIFHFETADCVIPFIQAIGGVALDLFGLGSDLLGIFSGGIDKLEKSIKELSQKTDLVLSRIQELQATVIDLFAQQDLKARLVKVEDFQRSTSNRIRELKAIAVAPASERNKYKDIFVRGFQAYSDSLYDIIGYITEPTLIYSQDLLDNIRVMNRCDMTYLSSFVNFSRSLICSGITAEAAYKLNHVGVDLTDLKAEWEIKLAAFDAAVANMFASCAEQFDVYFSEDIKGKKTFPEMLVFLERRYLDRSFFGVDISDQNALQISSNAQTNQLSCLKEKCGTMKCYAYTKTNVTCSTSLKIHIAMTVYEGEYFLSEDWPGTLTPRRDSSGSTLTLVPLNCVSTGFRYALQSPAGSQLEGTVTCGATTGSPWQPLLLIVLILQTVYLC